MTGAGASPYTNPNIRLALSFAFLSSLARNIWAFTVLSKYVEELTGSKSQVGIAEGIQGAAQAGVAVLAGFLADYTSVDRTLKLGGVLGLLAVSITLAALLAQGWLDEGRDDGKSERRFFFITLSLGCWGAYQGVWTTVLETAIANSVPTGTRSRVNTAKFMLMQLAGIAGPAIALCLFVQWTPVPTCKRDWPFGTLRLAFVVGVALSAPPAALLLLFDDSRALGRESEARRLSEGSELSNSLPLLGEVAVTKPPAAARCCGVGRRHVAWVLLASDLISGFGSGMSVKFFPLYFSEDLHLEACGTNAIYVGLPIFMAATSFAFQRGAERFGRVQACLVGSYVGSVALASMAFIGWYGKVSAALVLPIYFVSTVQHCVRPIKKAILMDYVTKSQRSRWNAVDSVCRFGWSGSAVLGGFLLTATNNDYGTCFMVTATMQAVAASLFWILVPLVPRQEALEPEEEPAAGRSSGPRCGDDALCAYSPTSNVTK